MGVNALLASVLCLTLPETKGKPTEETLDASAGHEMAQAAKRGQVAPAPEPEPMVIANTHLNVLEEEKC